MSARRVVVASTALAALVATGASSRAPGAVTVDGPVDEPLRSVTPSFVITASGFAPADHPLAFRLQLARSPAFDQLVFDSTLAPQSADLATIELPRALPEGATLRWRASVYTAARDSVRSATSAAHTVGPWLTLVSPGSPSGSTLQTRRPMFVWSSARAAQPGPWRYDFDVSTAIGGQIALQASGLGDTTYTAAIDLETNTSYRWTVTARLTRGEVGDTVRRTSASTFVIVEAGQPLATLLYQNFPNPFPTASSSTTCIWFDLHDRSTVQLDVLDLRGNLVRTLLPTPSVGTVLDPGRYGRGSIDASGEGAGCDARFRWDGRANNGRSAPNGVYLLRLAADGTVLTRKIVLQR